MEEKVKVFPTHEYTEGNEDNITEAVRGLDRFMKNWCMNCEETAKMNEPVFRCSECIFSVGLETGYCAIKKFANNHKHEYPMQNFGCMIH